MRFGELGEASIASYPHKRPTLSSPVIMSSRPNVCIGPNGEDAENIVPAGQSQEKGASDERPWFIISVDAPVESRKESQAVVLMPSEEECATWVSIRA